MKDRQGLDGESVELLVGQIASEYTQRLRKGEHPSVEEYARKYPEIADVLSDVLPALDSMRLSGEAANSTDDDPYLAAPLGDFQLIREIGHGGMGLVYEAKQISLNRTVAVKVLPFAATLDPRQLQRFKNEALAAASLHHENIVPVYFVGCERGVHFYAMELIDGLSLAALIKELRRQSGRAPAEPEQTAPYLASGGADTSAASVTALTQGSLRSREYFDNIARLGLQAARGLEHAHQQSIRHRDIKPANLLVNGAGRLWIADFGLAQMQSNPRVSLTGELVGTLRYMSPEQTMARRVPVDHRTDVYSLGATLYELLTLEQVFDGGEKPEILRQILFEDPIPPRHLNRHVPRDLETIVLTALAKSPARRYGSAREMAEDLQRFLNDEPIKARPETFLGWLCRHGRRHAAAITLTLAAVVTSVVLLLLVWHLSQPTPEERENQRQQQALAALTHDLEQGKKVTLIGERGRPGYFRWKTDEQFAKHVEASDGVFTLQNWEHGLVELLPDPRVDRFRFSAEVRHERQLHQESLVGIYFSETQFARGDGVAHYHCNVVFNNLVDVRIPGATANPIGNAVGLQVHRQPPRGQIIDKAQVEKAQTYFIPSRPHWTLGPWHRITVEVRPQVIKVYWKMDCNAAASKEKCIAVTPRDVLLSSSRILLANPDQPLPPDAPQFGPQGGLGLYVSQGVASFRNVTVEPLDGEN